jgi:hypothetical protein
LGRRLEYAGLTGQKRTFDSAGDEAPARARCPRALRQRQRFLTRCAASRKSDEKAMGRDAGDAFGIVYGCEIVGDPRRLGEARQPGIDMA